MPQPGLCRGRPDPGRSATAVRFGTHPAPSLVGTRRAKKAAANPIHNIKYYIYNIVSDKKKKVVLALQKAGIIELASSSVRGARLD